ncbi:MULTISPECIES: helix-turn-helix domain-containing protein [Sphingomonas]|uniref:helix-turn-helix domain-containing protein n=1 Tax=Sphingomonas TaxID=13687 RepID=UPI000ADD7DA1|nr:helix-turn-helix transcriptional regulator [Sphingomonas sp. CCH10-B3]
MIVADRLRSRMESRKISQAELARRLSISQSSINRLATGDVYASKHIYQIARELGTSPEYLMGETDDPEEGAPPPPELDYTDRELLESFRCLAIDDQRALLQIVRSMAGRGKAPTLHAPALSYRGEVD